MLELKTHQKNLLFRLARYHWWGSPLDSVKKPQQLLAHVMAKGEDSDVIDLARYFETEILIDIIKQGLLEDCPRERWIFWHVVLDLSSIENVPSPSTSIFWQDALKNFICSKGMQDVLISPAQMFQQTSLAQRLVQVTESSKAPIYQDILKKLRAGENLYEALENASLTLGGNSQVRILCALCSIHSEEFSRSDLLMLSDLIKKTFKQIVNRNN